MASIIRVNIFVHLEIKQFIVLVFLILDKDLRVVDLQLDQACCLTGLVDHVSRWCLVAVGCLLLAHGHVGRVCRRGSRLLLKLVCEGGHQTQAGRD